MNRLTCTECHQPIPNGEAVIRSRTFVQVAFHPGCYAPDSARIRADLPPAIPTQRTGAHDQDAGVSA